MTVGDIIKYAHAIADCRVSVFDSAKRINGVTLPEVAGAHDLAWSRSGIPRDWHGGILISDEVTYDRPGAIVACDNPRLVFFKVVNRFFQHLEGQGKIKIADARQIHSSAVIGAAGQGYIWDEAEQEYVRMPQLGGLVIEENVLVGPNTTIMRGAIGDTVIRAGTIIGNGVNIGHGSQVGRHCLIVAHALIGGSAVLKDHVTVWQGAMIANSVCVGAGAIIGMGAVVLNDVPAGETWAGNPARKL